VSKVKPYLVRIKNWKIRNMVMLYLEAREQFKNYRRMVRRGTDLPFDKLREISDILFEIKEDHHLLYRRIIDPKKKRFENTQKFTPDEVEIDFMNNIGLLFHKMMAARELKYVMDHYLDTSRAFKKNQASLRTHLNKIDNLFDEGIDILKSLIMRNRDNILLLTLLLENPSLTRKHFGEHAEAIMNQFGNGNGLDEVYFSVAKFYHNCGRYEEAQTMYKSALKKNARHKLAKQALKQLT